MRLGQALVIVLLVLAVALTTGLAIISRSIIDVGVSTSQQESARALSVAEAGVELKLSGTLAGDSGSVGTGSSGGTYTVSSSNAGAAKVVSFPESLKSGEVVTLFLTAYNSDGALITPLTGTFSGRMDVCWGDTAASETPALEAELYYSDGSTYLVKRLAYDPGNRANGFSSSGISTPPSGDSKCPTDKSYKYGVSWGDLATAFGISGGDDPVFMRFRMWYNTSQAQPLAVGSDVDFPVQGQIVTSSGTAGSSTRKIQVFQRYPDPFPLFDMAVFSGGSLVK